MPHLVLVTIDPAKASQQLEALIFEQTERLGAFCDSITTCHVSVDGPVSDGDDAAWSVRIVLKVFGQQIAVGVRRPSPQGPVAALNEAFERVKASLETISREHCGCGGQRDSSAIEGDSHAAACGVRAGPRRATSAC